MPLYITCDTDHEGRLVQCFLKHVGIITRIRGGAQGSESGGTEGGVVVVFIVRVLWLGSRPCPNIVMQEAKQLVCRAPEGCQSLCSQKVSVSLKDNK